MGGQTTNCELSDAIYRYEPATGGGWTPIKPGLMEPKFGAAAVAFGDDFMPKYLN